MIMHATYGRAILYILTESFSEDTKLFIKIKFDSFPIYSIFGLNIVIPLRHFQSFRCFLLIFVVQSTAILDLTQFG